MEETVEGTMGVINEGLNQAKSIAESIPTEEEPDNSTTITAAASQINKLVKCVDKVHKATHKLKKQSSTQQFSNVQPPLETLGNQPRTPQTDDADQSDDQSDAPATAPSPEPSLSPDRASASDQMDEPISRKRPKKDGAKSASSKRTKKVDPKLNGYQFRVLQHFLRTGIGHPNEQNNTYTSTYFPTKTYLLIHILTTVSLYTDVKESSDGRHSEEILAGDKDKIRRAITSSPGETPDEKSVDVRIMLTYSPCHECITLLENLIEFLRSGCFEKEITVQVYFVQLYKTQVGGNNEGLRRLQNNPNVSLVEVMNWDRFYESFMAWVRDEESESKRETLDKDVWLSNTSTQIQKLIDMSISGMKVYKALPEYNGTFQRNKVKHHADQKRQLQTILEG